MKVIFNPYPEHAAVAHPRLIDAVPIIVIEAPEAANTKENESGPQEGISEVLDER